MVTVEITVFYRQTEAVLSGTAPALLVSSSHLGMMI
jgi:hypothetical protein